MAWVYEQSTGRLLDRLGHHVATGYAGRDAGKNNPEMQSVKGIGPLPVGTYRILPPVTSQVVGLYAMPLLPVEETETFGRASFYIHGDSRSAPGQASHGCIIMPHLIRQLIWESGDKHVRVVRGFAPDQQQEQSAYA